MSRHTTRIDRRLDAVLDSDPRVSDEYVRLTGTADHPVVLVGVVHDHPASSHRVRAVIDAVAPDTVALELPSIMVPVLEAASKDADPVGGEMTAAIEAAESTPVVGIDLPGRGAGRALVTELRRRDASWRTVGRSLRVMGRLVAHSVLGRLAHAGVPGTPSLADLEFGHEYDLPANAAPREQAEHEAAHLRRSTTLLRAFEPPRATRILDAVRERQMAGRLRSLGERGSVVAVVGYSHLSGIERGLEK